MAGIRTQGIGNLLEQSHVLLRLFKAPGELNKHGRQFVVFMQRGKQQLERAHFPAKDRFASVGKSLPELDDKLEAGIMRALFKPVTHETWIGDAVETAVDLDQIEVIGENCQFRTGFGRATGIDDPLPVRVMPARRSDEK